MAPTRLRMVRFAVFLLAFAFVGIALPAAAQTPEYRAYWADTFNTELGTHAEIDRLIESAVDSNANAIFAQIRRRGDSWYLDSLEPLTQVAGVGEPDADGRWTFDPLRYLIDQAHLRGIEVHAFVIIGSIYNAHPTITGLPKDPKHAFRTNFWDTEAGALYPLDDARQWATRSLPHNQSGTTFDGQRYGSEWYIDLGHPDAAAYTVDVLTHLVRKYDIDGIHLDRIRYPEAPINRLTGVPASINVGYNQTSVNRFKARYGDAATYYATADVGTVVSSTPAPVRYIGARDVGYPRTGDPLWNDWRREQVTHFVRRLYLNVTAVNPRIKVSAALICFWTGPVGSGGWEKTEAYYRVFQDWRAWAQEGILDILSPMIYKREHSLTLERPQFDDWLSFTKSLAQTSGRHALPGLGVYINSIEGSLRQARRALARAPFAVDNTAADGVIFYALGSTVPGIVVGNSTNAAVTNNPLAYPIAPLTTPKRSNAEFFSALRTGASVDGLTLFEDPADGALFPTAIPTPDMPWKSAPAKGHVMGFATLGDGTPLDGAVVTIQSLSSPGAMLIGRTDGGGFFGAVGLAPGTYWARVDQGTVRRLVCQFDVTPGLVTSVTAGDTETTAPLTTAMLAPATPTGDNGWYLGDVSVSLAASDDCSGVVRTEYSLDGGATWQTYSSAIAVSVAGTTVFHYRSVDASGNVEPAASVTIKIDKSNPTLTLSSDRDTLWPPNGRAVDVILTAAAADAVSGLASVTYQVVDEYGMAAAIAPRALAGASAEWTDTVALEARRLGEDLDGRSYRIVATVRDVSGRTATALVGVLVPHDQR